jgi:putative ATP-dependent endonuclease of OLD family
MIEPLTAKRIAVVEGPSDRIIVARAAELLGLNLDRAGVAVFELDGASLFPTANKLFGRSGFDLPLYGLVDGDAADGWAAELGVARADLETAGIIETVPDLEAAYADALGVSRVVAMLVAAHAYTEQQILGRCRVATTNQLTAETVAAFCRNKKRKTRAAIAIAQEMTDMEAGAIDPIVRLLKLVSS